MNFPESALAAEYGLVELSILPLQVFPSLLHIIIISIVITIIVIIMIIFAERGLFEQLSAHGLAFPIAAAAEGRYEGALDLFLSIEHYYYFFITIIIIFIYIRCHPSRCPTAWTAYPCPFPFHQVILILITSITRC